MHRPGTIFHLISLPVLLFLPSLVSSDPQANLVNKVCGWFNATDASAFSANLDAAFTDLRKQLSSARFATTQRVLAPDPVFALSQCRDYLSPVDCLACYAAATVEIRSCGTVTDAFVVFDGCFLRYRNNNFFDQTSLPGGVGLSNGFCGENRLSESGDKAKFNLTVLGVLSYIVTTTPKDARFYEVVAARSGDGPVVYGVGQCVLTVSLTGCSDCLSLAYQNIRACPPAAEARAVDLGCFLRYSDQAFFNGSAVADLDHLVNSGGSSNKKVLIGWTAGAGGAALLVAALALIWCHLRRRESRGTVIVGLTDQQGPSSFDYNNLRHATTNFSDKNKLGQGGFAAVYKGVLRNGKTIAVKKITISETARARENFDSEVTLISNIRHRNLLRLLGFCRKGPDLLLVYEYMEKGSLDKYIYGDGRRSLSWRQRFDIIVGIARGLAFLHEDFPICVIHRDVKPANILLDEQFQPKLADFGLSRLLPDDQSHMSTRMAGTIGYVAPEYIVNGQLSEKVDTYSFGVVVLETVSGRRSNALSLDPDTVYLLEWAWRLYETGSLLELVDEHLELNLNEAEEMKRTVEIGLMCTQSAYLRPAMSEVVALLLDKEGRNAKCTLNRPNFIAKRDTKMRDESISSQSTSSNATITISRLSAR